MFLFGKVTVSEVYNTCVVLCNSGISTYLPVEHAPESLTNEHSDGIIITVINGYYLRFDDEYMHCASLIIFAVCFALRLDEETTRDMSPTNVITSHAVSSTSLLAGGGLSAKISCPDVMQFATDTPVLAGAISSGKLF